MDKLSAEELYKGMYDELYTALKINGLNAAVAHFLANLAVDVARLKLRDD